MRRGILAILRGAVTFSCELKTMEISQLQKADTVSDVPVRLVVQAPQSQVVAETVHMAQLLFSEKIDVITEIGTVPGTRTESANADSVHKVTQAFVKGLTTDLTICSSRYVCAEAS